MLYPDAPLRMRVRPRLTLFTFQESYCMSKNLIALLSGSMLVACLVCAPVTAEEEDSKPKFTTKEVMKTAMKGGLLKKVASGDASDEEKTQLHEMLVALGKNQPKKGEADSWKELTEALVKAGQAAVDGDEDAGDMLTKASNCKACHDKHK
jgi:hypothetical protein